jgi:membrane associated rhomboid family serine protease
MIPVSDFVDRHRTPYVNWTLLGINIVVFIYMLTLETSPVMELGGRPISEAELFFYDWGFVPACIADHFATTEADPGAVEALCPGDGREPLQLVSAMFVHAGWAHLFGNMLFLWIFGDNVEDRLGHVRYLVFYLLAGLAASATQILLATDTLIPNVGASGAIAGVMGAYLFLHPTAVVQVVIFPLFFIPFFVPALLLIAFWFITQLFAGIAELGETTAGGGVAWWAHIGGFVAGFVLIILFGGRGRKRASRRYG